MKKSSFIIGILLVLFSVTFSQKLTEKNYSKLYVNIEAETLNPGDTYLNMKLLKQLNSTKALREMNLLTSKNVISLQAKLYFPNMKSFLEWYEDKETSSLLKNIKSHYGAYRLEINLQKLPKK